MSRLACVLFLLLLATAPTFARHHHVDEAPAPVFHTGGLQFAIPAAWRAVPPESSARAGQWVLPPPADQPDAEGVQIVVFFFGPGVGGSARENDDAWAQTVIAPDGSVSKPTPQTRTVAGHTVTKILLGGTYEQANRQSGLPPTAKLNYALIGEVIESPGGNIYWRATGPVAQVTALEPVLDQAINSLKPDNAPPGAKP